MNMRKLSGTMICALVWSAAGGVLSEPQLLNGIAAKVNGKIITQEEISSAITANDRQLLMRLYGRQPALLQEKMRQLRQDALDQLVDRELILHEFETAEYQLPESVIDEYMKGIIRERYGDRLNLVKELQLKGQTMGDFRREVRADYIVQAMRQKNVSASVLISPYKIETYYAQNTNQFRVEDQIRLRMIFLANRPDRPAPVTRQLADEILSEIRARSVVQGDGGGLLGWITTGGGGGLGLDRALEIERGIGGGGGDLEAGRAQRSDRVGERLLPDVGRGVPADARPESARCAG